MARISDEIGQSAIAWHMRQDEMDAADWHMFVEWLEADPRHAEAFDRLTLADNVLAQASLAQTQLAQAAHTHSGPSVMPSLPQPANDLGTPGWRVSRWMAGAAACAAAMAAIVVFKPASSDPYSIQTAAGETRQVDLGGGSHVEIAGGSLLLLDRARPRHVTVERGEALFHVQHNAADPFVVRSGALEVQDVGTVFNVTRNGGRFTVAVAEGSVMFQPKREAVTLTAGATLTAHEDRQEVRVGRTDAGLVGGWRTGRLSFTDTPVVDILAEVQRLYGTKLVADDDLSSRKVTAMMTLSGEARHDVPHIASLIGASWRKDGERWILSPVAEPRP